MAAGPEIETVSLARRTRRPVRPASDPTRATLPPGPGLDPEPPDHRPRHTAWSTHADRSDRDGAGRARRPAGPRRRGPRRNEPTGGRHRAVRFDAATARGRSPLRPPDPALEPQDEARSSSRSATGSTSSTWPRPSSALTSPSSSSARPSPAATRSCSSAPRSRPRSPSPRRRPAPTSRTSTSAGSAACSPTS